MVYLLLGLLAVAGGGLAYRKEPATTRMPAFLVACALVALADWICFGWFELYRYHPGLSAVPRIDWTIGEFLADFIFVPSLAVTLLSYLPTWMSIVAGSAVVTGLEYFLDVLGKFEHHGWHLWYTAAGFPLYFGFCAWYWRKLHGPRPLAEPWLGELRTSLVPADRRDCPRHSTPPGRPGLPVGRSATG